MPHTCVPDSLRVFRGSTTLPFSLLVLSLLSTASPALAANKRVLFYGPTSGGFGASTPGIDATVWDEATWRSKTTVDFRTFDAIVFGDQPPCDFGGDPNIWNTAIATRDAWSAAITGNVIVLGTDPDFHGKQRLVEQSVLFAAFQPGATGLYVALGCYFHYVVPAESPVTVELLRGLGEFRALKVRESDCPGHAIKVAAHPALNGIDDAYLSWWSCSTHEGFHSWPAGYTPLAIITDVDPATYTPGYVGPEGVRGLVYVLASERSVRPAHGHRVAAGNAFSIGLHSDGSVWTWGFNASGQLGDGTTLRKSTPVRVPGLSGVKTISAGGSHGLALKNDGTLWAWGANNAGQLGDGTNVNRSTPVEVSGLTGVTAIAAGNLHSLALLSDGTVWAWGANVYGQLGNGSDTSPSYLPVQVSGLSDAVAISAGVYHSLAVRGDGTGWAWGRNAFGQLGNGGTTNAAEPVQISGLTNLVDIAGGSNHSLGLLSDGTVQAWGANWYGQLGIGSTVDQLSPAAVATLTGVTALAAGVNFSLALGTEGRVWSFGVNFGGQLGDGSSTNRLSPVPVGTLSGVASIAAGYTHSLALKSGGTGWGAWNDGTGWAWGYNSQGQLGDRSDTLRLSPVLIGPTQVLAGMNFSLALKGDGTVAGWGENYYGQLGDGTTINRTTPVAVSGLSGVVALSAGGYHGLAVKYDGSLWVWGANAYGQLGDGTTTYRYLPVPVTGISGVLAASGGDYHSLALKNDGTLWSWGYNAYGQLGTGDTNSRYTPVPVSNLTSVTDMAAAISHSVAVLSDGTVWAWGLNDVGRLGDGTTTNRSLPVQVSGLTNVLSVSARFHHSIARKLDGTVWGWGADYYGALGRGTTGGTWTPVQMSGITDAVSISAGYYHSLVIRSDGSLWACGYNGHGGLGDGTLTDRYLPVPVSGLAGVRFTSGGYIHSLATKSDGSVWGWGYNYYGQVGDGTTTLRNVPVPVAAFTLELNLSDTLLAPDGIVAVDLVVRDGSGGVVARPSYTVTVAAAGPTTGNAPLVSGHHVSFPRIQKLLGPSDPSIDPAGEFASTSPSDPNYGKESGGIYTVTATLDGTSLSRSATVVLLPSGTAGTTVKANRYSTAVHRAVEPLSAAFFNGDRTAIEDGKLRLDSILADPDNSYEVLGVNRIAAPPDGFPWTLDQLAAAGLTGGADDAAYGAKLQDLASRFLEARDRIEAMDPSNVTQADLDALAPAVAACRSLTQELAALNTTTYGAIENSDAIDGLVAEAIPQLSDAMTAKAQAMAAQVLASNTNGPLIPPQDLLGILFSMFTDLKGFALGNIIETGTTLANALVNIMLRNLINSFASGGLTIEWIQASAAVNAVCPFWPQTFIGGNGFAPNPNWNAIVLIGCVDSQLLRNLLTLKWPSAVQPGDEGRGWSARIRLIVKIVSIVKSLGRGFQAVRNVPPRWVSIGSVALGRPDQVISAAGEDYDWEMDSLSGWPDVNPSRLFCVGTVIAINLRDALFWAENMNFLPDCQ